MSATNELRENHQEQPPESVPTPTMIEGDMHTLPHGTETGHGGRGRLTVREDICYETPDGEAVDLSMMPYSVPVKGEDEPVRRKFTVKDEWAELPLCWADEWDSCSALLLYTIPQRQDTVPQDDSCDAEILLGAISSREGRTMHDSEVPEDPVPFSRVPIGMPVRIYPPELGSLWVRCVGGTARCQLVIIPS